MYLILLLFESSNKHRMHNRVEIINNILRIISVCFPLELQLQIINYIELIEAFHAVWIDEGPTRCDLALHISVAVVKTPFSQNGPLQGSWEKPVTFRNPLFTPDNLKVILIV